MTFQSGLTVIEVLFEEEEEDEDPKPPNGAFLFPPSYLADRTIPVSLLSSGRDNLPLPEKI